jgi:hypothetical protein
MASGIKFHGIIAQEVMRIDSSGSIGIGTSYPNEVLGHWSKWHEILTLAETNPAVKIALDKLMTVYHLSKDHGNNET